MRLIGKSAFMGGFRPGSPSGPSQQNFLDACNAGESLQGCPEHHAKAAQQVAFTHIEPRGQVSDAQAWAPPQEGCRPARGRVKLAALQIRSKELRHVGKSPGAGAGLTELLLQQGNRARSEDVAKVNLCVEEIPHLVT